MGESSDELVIRVSPDLIRKGLTIMGSWLYNLADLSKSDAGYPAIANHRSSCEFMLWR